VNLRFWRPKQEIYGVTLSESSSQVAGYSQPYVRPEVSFQACYDYYRTIGKVQNAVESYVAEVLSRDWYFEGPQEGVQACEEWEGRFNLSRLIEYVVRDWLVCGNSIIGVSDWQPAQISSIIGMKRSQYGETGQFVQQVNGREVLLDASRFIHTQYIEVNREAWGVGMFHSLMATYDYGSKRRSLPHLEIYRRQIQLFYRILERYGSPVTMWFFENVAKAEFDRQVGELQALEPGDRRILSKKVEIATETIDGRGNLINATSPVINQEIEAGLQTSANRLITQPSAMADARIGEEKDSARLLGIMEKIRRMMDALVIPRITPHRVGFRWGKQDNFQFDFDQLLQAKSAGFVSAEEGRAILKSVGWKLDDSLFLQQEGPGFLEQAGQLHEYNDCHDPNSGQFCGSGGSPGSSKSSDKIGRSKRAPPAPKEYTDAYHQYDQFSNTTELKGYSFDPATDKGYDALNNESHGKELYDNYGDGENDLYIAAVTNHQGDLDRETESAYYQVVGEGRNPLIGFWIDSDTGFEHTDISSPMTGMTEQELRNALRENQQKTYVAVTKEGKGRLVHVD
jgi:hypothetical protein